MESTSTCDGQRPIVHVLMQVYVCVVRVCVYVVYACEEFINLFYII